MKMLEYIEKYGHLSFEEKKLNEVDKLIFANLSYVDFKETVSNNDKIKKRIEDVYNEFKKKKYHQLQNIISIKGGIDLFFAIAKTDRYKDLLLYNFEHNVDDKEQFGAVTIEINNNLVYVSFEGTTEEMIGWEEDFYLSYQFPIISQKSAIKYLNKNFTFNNKKIITGGHSKGGNLALVSSMYCNFIVRRKIKEIYSYDGPGLLEKYLHRRRYKRIAKRYNHIVPKNSFIGMMLFSKENKVVDTKAVGMVSHFSLNWQVDDQDLIYVNLNKSSMELHNSICIWLNKYNKKQKKIFVREMFNVFRKNNIYTLLDFLKRPSAIIKIVGDSKRVSHQTRIMFKEFVKMSRKFFINSVKERIIK